MIKGVKKDYPLADETTFKIGGPAEFFIEAENRRDLEATVMEAYTAGLKTTILGGGSNVLVSSEGVAGVTVKLRSGDIEFLDTDLIRVDAGTSLPRLSTFSYQNSFTGLEWAMGVPGTLGGAVYGNAGAFGQSIADVVEEVEVLEKGKKEVLGIEEIDFSYRSSTFKERGLIILSASLRLEKDDESKIKDKIDRYLSHRNRCHPMSFACAGSTFKNPIGKIEDEELLKEFPEIEEFNKGGVIPAGYLIEAVGLKGVSVGGAKFSEKHANFIINEGGAGSEDVKRLINEAISKVKTKFGVDLEREIRYIG